MSVKKDRESVYKSKKELKKIPTYDWANTLTLNFPSGMSALIVRD